MDGTVTISGGVFTFSDLQAIIESLRPFQAGNRSKKAAAAALIQAIPALEPEITGLSENKLLAVIGFILAFLAMVQNQVNADAGALQMDHLIHEVQLFRQQLEEAERQVDNSP